MTDSITCDLIHHGAAASSSSKVLVCIPSITASQQASDNEQSSTTSTDVVYASHAMLNIARRTAVKMGSKEEPVWNVYQTLRTNTSATKSTLSTTARRVITSVERLRSYDLDTTSQLALDDDDGSISLVCGFSDGTITFWTRDVSTFEWTERPLVHADMEPANNDEQPNSEDGSPFLMGRSVTAIDGRIKQDGTLVIVTSNSAGAHYYEFPVDHTNFSSQTLVTTPSGALKIVELQHGGTPLILVGTAAPKFNKIHIFTATMVAKPHYCGALIGHEDWISSFDWTRVSPTSTSNMLASGSHDARIRLWKFTTMTAPTSEAPVEGDADDGPITDENEDEENAASDDKEEEEDEGESRLEIYHNNKITSITLEALLIGHEERITSVNFHPNPKSIYNEDMIIVSSSMDRAIFVWSQLDEDGVWTPISRVGSAGGILGGSIGSSLLGFINTQIEPIHGRWILGHGYGGALHFFSCHTEKADGGDTTEDASSHVTWKAQPCITGHFESVNDICWEASNGSYLLTASSDHTCRLWAPLASTETDAKEIWVEVARPQVHGYHLSAVSSTSSKEHPHSMVSGADEKELRAFDATKSFLRLFQSLGLPGGTGTLVDDGIERVERAFVPSLGLSNKANAADAAEEDTTSGVSESSTNLPLERDLGAVSLWPEVQKLYGHDTELFRLISTASARTGPQFKDSPFANEMLVASSAKARDVEAACIRLWDVKKNLCSQVLQGGHKSTVATLSFSADGKYLASSGKDRRLCIWRRSNIVESEADADASKQHDIFFLSAAIDGAHKRIIWSVHFCPFDPTILASGSRDGSVKIWKLTEQIVNGSVEVTMNIIAEFFPKYVASNGKPDAVTSLNFAPRSVDASNKKAILALGLESGLVELWSVCVEEGADESAPSADILIRLPPNVCHISTVTKMAWRPLQAEQGEDAEMYLATGSADHGCRVFKMKTVRD